MISSIASLLTSKFDVKKWHEKRRHRMAPQQKEDFFCFFCSPKWKKWRENNAQIIDTWRLTVFVECLVPMPLSLSLRVYVAFVRCANKQWMANGNGESFFLVVGFNLIACQHLNSLPFVLLELYYLRKCEMIFLFIILSMEKLVSIASPERSLFYGRRFVCFFFISFCAFRSSNFLG